MSNRFIISVYVTNLNISCGIKKGSSTIKLLINDNSVSDISALVSITDQIISSGFKKEELGDKT